MNKNSDDDASWETMSESSVSTNPSATTSTNSSVSYALSGLSVPTSYASSEMNTPIDVRIQRTKDTMATETNVIFDAECLKKRSNWSVVTKKHNLVEYPGDPNVILDDIETNSPKLNVLLQKIKSLDESDMREHGNHFKHMIYTGVKSNNYGVKIIASVLISNGMVLGYKAEPTESGKKKFSKIQMLSDDDLHKNKGSNFYLLSSVTIFDQPISSDIKKNILTKFNARPENIHGKDARFIVIDSGFKEGIDLFDIKYIHILEPQVTVADEKQVIGRGTRTCGQKGLKFQPNIGWSLNVFIYDISIPNELKGFMGNVDTVSQLYMKSLNLDLRLFSFTGELEDTTIIGSVDYDLNAATVASHTPTNGGYTYDKTNAEISGGIRNIVVSELSPIVVMPEQRMSYTDLRKRISQHFGRYKWDKMKIENLCIDPEQSASNGSTSKIVFTPTQNFLKHYFIPSNPIKGMLLWHSTGSGKTCSAIATASNEFEKEGYTILWVTRTTLKSDLWKNMFDQVCHQAIRESNITIPSEQRERMKLLSKSWRIRPMSYKQFSNLVSKQNRLYDTLVKINGPADPLRKTLIIIDEAHKLYGSNDLSSLEQPDMKELQRSLLNSYLVSGRDSVRLLLMTATPITSNPMEIIQLLNLCKPMGEQMPVDFEEFSGKYLVESTSMFSQLGRKQYLDDIAGYVSYLNREKDVRQFAQPILHHVRVPLVKMEDVKTFDKRIVREFINSDILKIKNKIEENNIELMGELNDLDVNKFKVLRKECESSEFKSVCNKIANKNMRKITEEAREEVKRIRNQIKQARESIKTQKILKNENISKIIENIKISPEEYEKFKKGMYYTLKTKCGKTIRTESELLKEHPYLEVFIRAEQTQSKKIDDMENMMQISENGFKNKIKELKMMLKTDLRDIERNVIKMVIKDNQKKARTAKKANTKTFEEQKQLVNKTRKTIQKQRNKVVGSLRDDLKRQLKDEKMEKSEINKSEKALRKQLREQDDYIDEIKHGVLTGLVDKYKVIMKDELKLETARQEVAQLEKKEARETANKTKKLRQEVAQLEKKEARETANKTKKLQKEAAKLEVKEARETANKTKKLQKETAKLEVKEARETANKTKKLQKEVAKLEVKEARETANKTKKLQKVRTEVAKSEVK